MRPRVVELSVSMALDRKASHRELTSVLISDLYGKAIKPKDIQQGFDGLLNNLKDLTIDYPEAPKVGGVQKNIFKTYSAASEPCYIAFYNTLLQIRRGKRDIFPYYSLIMYHIYSDIRRGFCPSRMTLNN